MTEGWGVNRRDGLSVAERPERLAVAFSRLLRGHGVKVPAGASLVYAEALPVLGFSSSWPLYWAGPGHAGKPARRCPRLRRGLFDFLPRPGAYRFRRRQRTHNALALVA